MTDPPFDVAKAHRWFAIEFNNAAWDLAELSERTCEASERMIHLAHAACHHWSVVGNEVNRLRALCLLSTVYHRIGDATCSLKYADLAVKVSEQVGPRQTPFDKATATACLAHATAMKGDTEKAQSIWRDAVQHAEALENEDRQVFDQFYPPLSD